MSKDNLILFPKKNKTNIVNMTRHELKWMISGSLFLMLFVAVGLNHAILSPQSSDSMEGVAALPEENRAIASINPIFKVSWEEKAFEVLSKTPQRELANVGERASAVDQFTFGFLKGQYQVREVDGHIRQIQFFDQGQGEPRLISDRQGFLAKHLGLFSDQAAQAIQTQVVDNDDRRLESYLIQDSQGQDLSTVQILLDQDQNLLSMTVL